jgi:hypothetical protein
MKTLFHRLKTFLNQKHSSLSIGIPMLSIVLLGTLGLAHIQQNKFDYQDKKTKMVFDSYLNYKKNILLC